MFEYRELMQDEAFVEELLAKETVEEVQEHFGNHGTELDEEDAADILDFIEQVRDGEITSDEIREILEEEMISSRVLSLTRGGIILGACLGLACVAGGAFLTWKLLRAREF